MTIKMKCKCGRHETQRYCDYLGGMMKPFEGYALERFQRGRLEYDIMHETCLYAGYDTYCTIEELQIILTRLKDLNRDRIYQEYELVGE